MLDRKADKVWCYTAGSRWLLSVAVCISSPADLFLLTMTTHSFFNLNCHVTTAFRFSLEDFFIGFQAFYLKFKWHVFHR